MDEEQLLPQVIESKHQAGEFFKKYLIDLVVAVILVIYIAKTIATIDVADKTVWEILADGAMAFVFATAVSELLAKQGVMRGESHPLYRATMCAYGEIVEKMTPYIEHLEDWCKERNARNVDSAQQSILNEYGISLERYRKGIENPSKTQREAIRKVRALKVHKYTVAELMGELNRTRETYGLGMTKQEYLRRKSYSGIIITLVCSVIFGYYTLRLASGFSVGGLIWACVQVGFFLIKGITSYVQAYMFTTDAHRNRIILKSNLLYEFYNQETKKEKENVSRRISETAEKSREGITAYDGTVRQTPETQNECLGNDAQDECMGNANDTQNDDATDVCDTQDRADSQADDGGAESSPADG